VVRSGGVILDPPLRGLGDLDLKGIRLSKALTPLLTLTKKALIDTRLHSLRGGRPLRGRFLSRRPHGRRRRGAAPE